MAGTALSSATGFLSYESEDSFADAADDSYSVRMQIRDAVIDFSGLQRPLLNRGGTFQRLNEGDLDIGGPFGVGTFTTTFDLYGHGTTTAGALAATSLSTLMGHAFGNSSAANDGGTVSSGNWSDANAGTTADIAVMANGSLCRIGARADGYGDGQVVAVDNIAANTLTLLTNAAGVPQDADVVYAMLMAYPVTGGTAILTSNGAATNNTLRFVLASANLQFVCRGCACTGATINLSPGERPTITFTWSTVQWEPVSQTFPSASATADFAPSPCVNGSLFINDFGTATRATDTVREFVVNIGQGMQPVFGQGGENADQSIVGWVRVPAPTTVSFAVEAQAATTSPTWWTYHSTAPTSQVFKHVLYTAAVPDGRALGIYLPRCKPMTVVPTQVSIDGLNYVRAEFEAVASTDIASELTLAPWVLGMG